MSWTVPSIIPAVAGSGMIDRVIVGAVTVDSATTVTVVVPD